VSNLAPTAGSPEWATLIPTSVRILEDRSHVYHGLGMHVLSRFRADLRVSFQI
jgi:hypothetical protein